MNNKKLSLIAYGASLGMAAACWSLPASGVSSSGGCEDLAPAGRFSQAHADVANPKKVDDDGDDAGNASGDATPVPEPQPVT